MVIYSLWPIFVLRPTAHTLTYPKSVWCALCLHCAICTGTGHWHSRIIRTMCDGVVYIGRVRAILCIINLHVDSLFCSAKCCLSCHCEFYLSLLAGARAQKSHSSTHTHTHRTRAQSAQMMRCFAQFAILFALPLWHRPRTMARREKGNIDITSENGSAYSRDERAQRAQKGQNGPL